MDISLFLERIEAIPLSSERQEFIDSVKRIEKEAYTFLTTQNNRKWIPGRGLEISEAITLIRDKVLIRIAEYCGDMPEGLSIVAVGGYGRMELSPHSDVDILILHKENTKFSIFINVFFYLLWDIGYHLGNSVRTIQNVVEHCEEDITLLTALFNCRLLAGDAELLEKMKHALQKVLDGMRDKYIRSKLKEIQAIYRQTGDMVLLKEPNLKETAGGLRSIHLASWINYAINGNTRIYGLKDVMDPDYYRRLFNSYDFILFIRNMLHFKNGRKEDTFLIDYHLEIANYLGFKGTDFDKVTRMMKRYYEKAMSAFLLSAYAIDRLFVQLFKRRMKKLAEPYMTLEGELFVRDDVPISPLTAFDAVLFFTKKKYNISYNLLRYLNASAQLINPKDNGNRDIFRAFRTLLSQPNAFLGLNTMKISDLLYKYLKPMEKIRHYILYNPFHKFTVDEHSLEAVKALEMLGDPSAYSELQKDRMRELFELYKKYGENLWVLKLALLLHDTGKPYPGEHSKNGVEITRELLAQYPINTRYVELILFLIENHLLFSHITRRHNIQDISVILDFSTRFILTPFPQEYLDFLFLLTYADIYATNPFHFNGYVYTLMAQVYKKTSMILSGKIGKDYALKQFEQRRAKVIALAKTDEIGEFIETLGQNYASLFEEEEIVADYKLIREMQPGETKVAVRDFNEFMMVKIFAPDRLGLFANLSGILALNGANIAKANIFTYRSTAFDVFYVTDVFGSQLATPSMQSELTQWIERVKETVQKHISDDAGLAERIENFKRKIDPLPSFFKSESKATCIELSNGDYRISVSGPDRPALLYEICTYFAQNRIAIRNAYIDTIGWLIRDEFIVNTDRHLSENDRAEISERIVAILEKR